MTEGATTRCQIPPGPAGAAPQAERSAGGFSFNPGAVWDESPLGLRYLGFERKTLRNVLVTLVRPELSRDPGFQECFRREIDLVRRLSHVHLSRTLGSGVFEGQLFYATQIPVCLWFLARTKHNGRFRDRRGETLFIDARGLGTLVDRTKKRRYLNMGAWTCAFSWVARSNR